jgi:hypothetical protein
LGGLISSIAATTVTIPFLIYIAAFIILKMMLKDHQKAVAISIDLTTFFLILSVVNLISVIWSGSYACLVFVIMLLAGMFYLNIYRRQKREFIMIKVLRGYWRLNFLLFTVTYFLLDCYGASKRILEALF